MIKKIIFDIDDTLIDFPVEYISEYDRLIKKLGYNFTSYALYEAIDKYEKVNEDKYYSEKNMIDFLIKELNTDIKSNFIFEFLKLYDELVSVVSDNIKETLDYLSSKYELVALSNWFTDSQKKRLKKTDILKYFTNVYGSDIIPKKPNKESYLKVIGDLKLDECLMIGDSLDMDIKVPYEMGINVLYLNKKNIETKYPSINKIEELKEML